MSITGQGGLLWKSDAVKIEDIFNVVNQQFQIYKTMIVTENDLKLVSMQTRLGTNPYPRVRQYTLLHSLRRSLMVVLIAQSYATGKSAIIRKEQQCNNLQERG